MSITVITMTIVPIRKEEGVGYIVCSLLLAWAHTTREEGAQNETQVSGRGGYSCN